MGARARLILLMAVGTVALVAPIGIGSAQDFAFCNAVAKDVPALSNNGVTGATKAYDYQGGVWCSYGTHGPYVQRIPHVSSAAFHAKQRQAAGKTVTGLGAPAFTAKAFGGYTTLSVLKGTTELVIGAKVSIAAEKKAAKAILPLVH